MRVHVDYSGTRDLESDMREVPAGFYRGGARVVRDNVADGGRTARRIARWTSGRHAKLYPSTITWDRALGVDAAAGRLHGSYGPEPRGQGKLASILENGSRNNPPHNNLDQSLDLIRPKFHRDTDRLLDSLFWRQS